VPEDSDVANAIGAVAGEVRVQKTLVISSSDGGGSFQMLLADGPQLFTNEALALEEAEKLLTAEILQMAEDAGAENPIIEKEIKINAPEVDSTRHFIEAKLSMSASGLPKIG